MAGLVPLKPEDGAAACGFIAGILSHLMGSSGAAIWISTARTLFPPALKTFGIQPDKIIFLDVKKPKDVLWAMEEALKCEVLTAVIGEVSELGFIESRRLQLAVERSKVTGFVLRDARKLNTTACMSRWMIAPCASVPIAGEAKDGRVDELPGLGFPQWKVKLLRIKNGRPGEWDIAWAEGKFMEVKKTIPEVYHQKKRAV